MKMNNATLVGVRMGEGFKDELYAPVELKEFVSNESRLKHGRRVITSGMSARARKASRTIALEFHIVGRNTTEFYQNRDAFFAQLYNGEVVFEVPELGEEVFRLIYLGKSSTYSSGLTNTACKVKVSFEEPNPNNRGQEP